jgi:CYTH domain-containing protein
LDGGRAKQLQPGQCIRRLIAQSATTFSPAVLRKDKVMPAERKYARIEWERRFLLDCFPRDVVVTRTRHISDRYIEGTSLRLRQQTASDGEVVFKLTQKVGDPAGARQGFITSMYLTRTEFSVLTQLPAKLLSKTRHSVPPFGIDVFEGVLRGLILAEAEFNSATEAAALALPSFIRQEVSDDARFTGGRLVTASRQELENWLTERGITLNA